MVTPPLSRQRTTTLRVAAVAALLAGTWAGTHPVLEALGRAHATTVAVPVPAVVTGVDHPSSTGVGTAVTVAVNGGTAKVAGLTKPVAAGQTITVVPDPADPNRAWPEPDLAQDAGTARATARVVTVSGLSAAAGAGGAVILWRAASRPRVLRRRG